MLSLGMTWSDMTVRRLLLVALVCYIVMRVWSFLFFIHVSGVERDDLSLCKKGREN